MCLSCDSDSPSRNGTQVSIRIEQDPEYQHPFAFSPSNDASARFFDFLRARSRNAETLCSVPSPRDQDATDRLLLPINLNIKHPCLVSSTASGLRLRRVGPWHFTMPWPLRRTAWCVGGVIFPCRFLFHAHDDRTVDTSVDPDLFKTRCCSSDPASTLIRDCSSRPP